MTGCTNWRCLPSSNPHTLQLYSLSKFHGTHPAQPMHKQETCFDARNAERPSDNAELLLDWRSRPPSIPDGVECSIEYRSSQHPRWVLLD